MEDLKVEDLFSSLDEIIKKLEDDSISLEDAFSDYNKGMSILKECHNKIDTIEKQVILLDEDGEEHEF